MKIQEYLQAKYKVQKATTMLKLEAKVFGIPYPNRYGWWERLEGLELTEEMRAKLIERLSAGQKKSRDAGLAALGVDATERTIKAIIAPNPPGTSKRARAKAKKLARSLALAVAQADKQRPVNKIKKVTAPARKLPGTVVLNAMPHVPMPPPSGVDPRSVDFLRTYEWRRVRMMALKRYGAVCQCCGAAPRDGAVMNVDHIKPRKFFPQLALDLENLQILCGPCNSGKGNWDMTDWRTTEQDHATDLDLEAQQHLRSISA